MINKSIYLEEIIKELLNHLPDSIHQNNCWDWCWQELDDEAQEKIKSVRKRAKLILESNCE